jgi:hypothetical protein
MHSYSIVADVGTAAAAALIQSKYKYSSSHGFSESPNPEPMMLVMLSMVPPEGGAFQVPFSEQLHELLILFAA